MKSPCASKQVSSFSGEESGVSTQQQILQKCGNEAFTNIYQGRTGSWDGQVPGLRKQLTHYSTLTHGTECRTPKT